MAGWVERQVDGWINRRIDRYVDKKLDGFLKGQMSDEDFKDLKKLTRKGEPIDADTQERLKGELGENFDSYVKIHNRVARMERFEQTLNKITRILP